ncbi:MAG: cobalt-precorrin-7 (C(5))-methyltransferase [Victivallales bacterium]
MSPDSAFCNMITRRDAATILLDASALRNLERILARAKEKRTLFLASGDPLYNGIGGNLRRHLPEDRLRIHPNPTAFQELFAKLAVPWENAALFSVHGKKTLPCPRILRSKLAVIYCDAEHSAKALAAELIAKYPGCAPRRAVAGCDIGMESEFIRSAFSCGDRGRSGRGPFPFDSGSAGGSRDARRWLWGLTTDITNMPGI